jgi:hypothetical protein
LSERFVIEQASRRDEYEYAVVDLTTRRVVALFLVNRHNWGNEERTFACAKRRAHLRARRVCVGLNRMERPARFDSSVPASDGVALVRGEAGERLVLDDLARARGGDDLAVADVHDDVTTAA